MYFKLNEKGIERYPDQGLTASTLLQDTGAMYHAPDAQNEIYKELVVLNEHAASLVFDLILHSTPLCLNTKRFL